MGEPSHKPKHLREQPPPDAVIYDSQIRLPSLGPLLIFSDRSLEQEFLSSANASWTKCDKTTLILSILMTGPKFVSFSSSDTLSNWIHGLCLLVFAVIIPAMLLKWIWENEKGHCAQRTTIMSCMKLVLAAGHGMIALTEDPFDIWNAKDFPHLLVRGFSRNPFVPVIILALGYPLPFWWHVVIQGLVCITGVPWVPRLSNVCDKVPRVAEAISRLGQITEGFLALRFPFDFGVSEIPRVYSCGFVASFYTVLLQFLVPSYIMYLLECGMRFQYLKGKLSEDEAVLQSHLKFSLVALATVVLIVCSQIVWFSGKDWGY